MTLVSYGRGVIESIAAATKLEQEGVSVEVLDLRTLVPLDVPALVESMGRTKRAVVVHDAVQFAGPGAEITAILQEELFGQLEAPVVRVGARFVPNPAAPNLEAAIYPSADRVVAAAHRTLDQATAGKHG